jgi:Pvc16 N-terminal domain
MTRVAIEVPFNTLLADLDDALRALLRAALARHGFNGVQISFDAPSREWAAGLSTPTLNLFMYDLREADGGGSAEWTEHRSNGQARLERPPLRVDCAYSITAWTRAVQDEHRMLSQTLAVLLAHERLPADVLGEPLARQADGMATRIGRAKREGSAEFWTALGGQYKLSLDYVVTLACDPGVTLHRGPEVRTQTVRVGERGSRAATTELNRAGGVVRRADGTPAGGAWVGLPDSGAFAVAGADGRFTLERVPSGRHRCEARSADGLRAAGELAVPGRGIDLTLGSG